MRLVFLVKELLVLPEWLCRLECKNPRLNPAAMMHAKSKDVAMIYSDGVVCLLRRWFSEFFCLYELYLHLGSCAKIAVQQTLCCEQ